MATITKRQILNQIIEGTIAREVLVEYATHEIELLDNKKANSKKVSKVDPALVEAITDALQKEGDYISIKDMNAKYFDKEYTSQKLSYILNNVLKEDVDKRMEKRVAQFKLKDQEGE